MRRITVLSDLLVHQVPVAVLCARWGLSAACLYAWHKALLLRGLDSWVYRHGGGRPEKVTPKQKKRLVELIDAGPQVVGVETACWNAVLIRVLIWREFGVLYHRPDVWTVLHHVGLSLQKARVVSDQLEAVKRLGWLEQKGPPMVRMAKRRQGLILCAEEASFAPWGAVSYPWARRGRPPEVPTSGKRKGSKVCGAIAYFSGRLCSPGIEGRFQSDSYHAFLQRILAQTTPHLFWIHAGARYHTSASPPAFLAAHSDRLPAEPLPS